MIRIDANGPVRAACTSAHGVEMPRAVRTFSNSGQRGDASGPNLARESMAVRRARMSVDASSTGNAMLRSADGTTLRCKFVFGDMSGTGFGECLDSAGTHYDLQIM
jgi:hypothetical protein